MSIHGQLGKRLTWSDLSAAWLHDHGRGERQSSAAKCGRFSSVCPDSDGLLNIAKLRSMLARNGWHAIDSTPVATLP